MSNLIIVSKIKQKNNEKKFANEFSIQFQTVRHRLTIFNTSYFSIRMLSHPIFWYAIQISQTKKKCAMCPHRKVKIIFTLEMKHQSTVNFMLTVDCLLRWLLYGFLPAQDEINLNKKRIINMFSDEFIINTY